MLYVCCMTDRIYTSVYACDVLYESIIVCVSYVQRYVCMYTCAYTREYVCTYVYVVQQ